MSKPIITIHVGKVFGALIVASLGILSLSIIIALIVVVWRIIL